MNLRGRNKVSPEFSMSSMTDIVFLLLVFFLLTNPAADVLDLVLPKASGKSVNQQNVSVSISKDLTYYIDKDSVDETALEELLLSKLQGQNEPTIILRAEQGVPIEKAVTVMDIANRNRFKIVLAVKP